MIYTYKTLFDTYILHKGYFYIFTPLHIGSPIHPIPIFLTTPTFTTYSTPRISQYSPDLPPAVADSAVHAGWSDQVVAQSAERSHSISVVHLHDCLKCSAVVTETQMGTYMHNTKDDCIIKICRQYQQ